MTNLKATRGKRTSATLLLRLVGTGGTGRPAVRWRAAVVVGLVLGNALSFPGARAVDPVRIEVVSNRPDLISGGDALVAVEAPSSPAVTVNGTDVSSAFVSRGGRYVGLVTGLLVGTNEVVASAGDARASLVVTNHPIGGPILSGPQVSPWLCETEAARLGPAQDIQCNAPTRVSYQYRSDSGSFAAYDPSQAPPDDVAMTTTDQGIEVPFIVRVERGTMNRGIYEFAVLFDPATGAAPAWNGKLHYVFGGGAAPNHRQGSSPPNAAAQGWDSLGRGFAIAGSTLNRFGQNMNSVTSAESVMMLKERIIEFLGREDRYTLATGCSGGSMGQHLVAETYPGLLDGIIPACSFPDMWTPAIPFVMECGLLERVFNATSPHLWALERQRAAVAGHMTNVSCASVVEASGLDRTAFDPRTGCMAGLLNPMGINEEPDYVYDPQTNPTGTRCTAQDYQKAIFGHRSPEAWGPVEQQIERGFANRPFDNVGVQYGLRALQSGEILPEQFVDLNEKIGGRDIDYNWTPERSTADLPALEYLYRSGQITSGRQLATVPIIDLRADANYEFHLNANTYMMRERLIHANGHADNQVIWITDGIIGGRPLPPRTSTTGQSEDANEVDIKSFDMMDRWLAAIEADDSTVPLAEKIVRAKPVDAVDTCWVGGRRITDPTRCRILFPYFGDPRIAAGGPLSNDVLKCQLRPMDRAEYQVSFTDDQWHRLESVFADGVCDFAKPSVGRQPSVPWLTFAAGPGGVGL